MTPVVGLEALAYKRFCIRPARYHRTLTRARFHCVIPVKYSAIICYDYHPGFGFETEDLFRTGETGMWKKLGLGVALLVVLGCGLVLIDKPVIGEPLAAASKNRRLTGNVAGPNERHRRHRRHRRGRRGNKNM